MSATPLTAAEVSATIRLCGYPVAAALARQPADVRAGAETVAAVLALLAPDEAEALRGLYLAPLAAMEVALADAADGLDIKKAAVYERNLGELTERTALITSRRMALCSFLGVPPGPGVTAGALVAGPDGTPTADTPLMPAIWVV